VDSESLEDLREERRDKSRLYREGKRDKKKKRISNIQHSIINVQGKQKGNKSFVVHR
jgi:hypothetical protein